MGSQTENLLTVIDVGSAKTCVIVAEVNDYALRYRGHGISDSRGMRKGVIADLDKAVDTIKKAVEEAENVAQAPVEHAVVSALNRAGIHVDDTVFEALACADSVLQTDERELGVCLVDVGAGSTDLIVYYEGVVIHTGAIPIGGDHFTNGVGVGFRTPLPDAENIKKMFGCAIVTRIPEGNEIEVPSVGDRPARMMQQRMLGEILEPRGRELMEMLRDHLRHAGMDELLG